MNAASSRKKYEVVVGYDLSELAERAIEEGIRIASEHPGADLHVVTVGDPAGIAIRLPGMQTPLEEDYARETVRDRVARILESYVERFGSVNLERVAVYVVTGQPAEEPAKTIARLADAVDADIIIVGTQGRTGLRRALLGSVAAHVVRDANTSVYVVRPRDFVGGRRVPSIEAPLRPGAPHLKQFEHRRTYHYVDKVAPWTRRIMPAS